MGTPLLVLTTFPDIDTAEQLAKEIVQAKLAACVNILPQGQSVYFWENELCVEKEHVGIIKTMENQYPQLESFLQNNHPYELPEIIATLITKGSDKYLTWIEQYITA